MTVHCALTNLKLPIVAALIVLSCVLSIRAQPPAKTTSEDRDRGIRLYQQGDTKAALSALRAAVKHDNRDGDAWYYLGLALVRIDDLKNARKAFETTLKLKPDFGFAHTGLAFTLMAAAKDEDASRHASRAIELNPRDAEAHYVLGVVDLRSWRNREAQQEAETAIAQKPNFAAPYLLKCQTLLALQGEASARSSKVIRLPTEGPPTEEMLAQRRLAARMTAKAYAAAADSLERYLKLAASDSETAVWREQLETLRLLAGNGQSGGPQFFSSSEVTTKVRILQKPEPTYTEPARMAGISGTVILRAVFSSTGTIEHILVLRSLPAGLTEQSLKVARKIRFEPATKDGKPVSMILELQYNFNLF